MLKFTEMKAKKTFTKLDYYGSWLICDELYNLELTEGNIKSIIRALEFTTHVEKYMVQEILGKINTQIEEQTTN